VNNNVTHGLEKLALAGAGNAILSVAFVIEWEDQPSHDQNLIAGTMGLAPAMLKLGYQSQPIYAVSFNFAVNQDAVQGSQQQQVLAGWSYVLRNPSGTPLREMTLRGNQLIITINDYSRWKKVWTDVDDLLNSFTPLLFANNKTVQAATLQYADKLVWRDSDPSTFFPLKSVLKKSPFFAEHALEQTNAWHSQYGCFATPFTDWMGSRIDNVNIACNQESGQWALTIITLHRMQRNPSNTDGQAFQRHSAEIFDRAHTENKKLLASLLTDHVCKMISLEV
jgi:uncharacterized protein (TIGR04255 family)